MSIFTDWAQRRRIARLKINARDLLVEYRTLEAQVGPEIASDVHIFHAAYPEARRFAVAFNRILREIKAVEPGLLQAELPVAHNRSDA